MFSSVYSSATPDDTDSVPAIVEPEEETAEQEDVVLSRRKDKWDVQEEEEEW